MLGVVLRFRSWRCSCSSAISDGFLYVLRAEAFPAQDTGRLNGSFKPTRTALFS
jgi:hypothetical protein